MYVFHLNILKYISSLYAVVGRQQLYLLFIIFYVKSYMFCIHVYQVSVMTDNHYHKNFLMACFIFSAIEAFRIDEI